MLCATHHAACRLRAFEQQRVLKQQSQPHLPTRSVTTVNLTPIVVIVVAVQVETHASEFAGAALAATRREYAIGAAKLVAATTCIYIVENVSLCAGCIEMGKAQQS